MFAGAGKQGEHGFFDAPLRTGAEAKREAVGFRRERRESAYAIDGDPTGVRALDKPVELPLAGRKRGDMEAGVEGGGLEPAAGVRVKGGKQRTATKSPRARH